MPGHVEPKQLASPVIQDKKGKQAVECHGLDHAKIDRRDRVGVIEQECSPSLRWRLAVSEHVLGDCRLGDLKSKLK
jgi:hypothetical protein